MNYKHTIFFIANILIFFCFSPHFCASQTNSEVLTYTDLQLGKDIALQNEAPGLLKYRIKKAKLLFRLDLLNQHNQFKFHDDVFTYYTEFTCNQINNETITIKLEINNNQPEAMQVIDLTELAQENLLFHLSQIGGSFNCENSPCRVTTNDLKLFIEYQVEYGIDRITPTGDKPLLSISNVEIMGKQVKVTWDNPNHIEFPNYQFQLLHLYNKSQNFANTPEEILTSINESDWKNSLNIITESSKSEYKFTMAEGEGFYVCRVRPISTYYDGGIANNKNWSDDQWSHVDYSNGNKIYNVNNITYPLFYYSDDPDKYLNYIYSRIFTEGTNNVSEQITYANGLNQVQQIQKYLPSTEKSIIVQNIYDYSGRPALTTLPVPIENSIIGYKTTFVANTTGTIYTAKNFDEDANRLNPQKVSESGDFNYYSSQNITVNQVPSAQGYPFTREIYSPDGTGRITETASPGYNTNLHDIAGDFTSRKTIRTFYCKPSEQELIRIFGAEAPKSESVRKTVNIDPNNIVSVNYFNEEGKLLASYLSKNNLPNQNSQLADLAELPTSKQITDEININVATDQGYISTHHIFVDQEENELKIGYLYNCDVVNLECGDVTVDCGFYLTINVYDVKTNHYILEYTFPEKISCGEELALEPIYNLTPGEYIITKKLSYDPNSVSSEYTEHAENSLTPIMDWIANTISVVKNEESQRLFYHTILKLGREIERCKPTSNPAVSICPGCPTLIELGLSCNLKLSSSHKVRLLTEAGSVVNDQDIDIMDLGKEILLIEVSTNCCDEFFIPCIFEGKYKCDMTEDPQFEEYLLAVTGGTLRDFLPGYSTSGDFNLLIRHMITDKYDISDGTGVHEQYTCDELWNAWVIAVSSFSKFKEINMQPVSAKDIDNENEDKGEKFDAHFNNNSNFRGLLGWAVKWIVKRKLSEIPRQESNVNKPVYHNVNLAEDFFSIVGHRFSKPLIWNGKDYLFNGEPPSGYNKVTNRYKIGASGSESHAYILDKSYAHRCYEYNYNTIPSAEYLNCFYADIDQSLFCQEVPNCDGLGFEQWKQKNIQSFFNYLVNYIHQPQNSSDITKCREYTLAKKYLICESTKRDCDGNCDSKYAEYRRYIEDEFKRNCYIIDGCETNVNSISSKAIDKLAEYTVSKCKEYYCPRLQISDIVCTEQQCFDIYLGHDVYTYPRIIIPECKLLAMQVSEWFLEIGVPSMCVENAGNKLCDQGDTEITVEKNCLKPIEDIEKIKMTTLRNITVTVNNGVVNIQ